MYKPPQNSNRVKSIKSKFENIENQKSLTSLGLATVTPPKNKLRSNLNLTATKKTGPLTETFRNTPSSTSNFSGESSFSPPKNKLRTLTPIRKADHLTSSYRASQPVEESPKNGHQSLTRQLSDPLKRNIKRTPAFRVDKNSDKSLEKSNFRRDDPNQKSLFEKKVKQFNSAKGCEIKKCEETAAVNISNSSASCSKLNCDLSDSVLKQNDSFLHQISPHPLRIDSSAIKTESRKTNARPLLIKSKSSHDFQYIRNKFIQDNLLNSSLTHEPESHLAKCGPVYQEPISPIKNTSDKVNRKVNIIHNKNDDNIEANLLKNIDLSLLYTEPIPKSLRNKNPSESSNSTIESPLFKPKIESIYNKSTLQLTDSDKKEFLESLKKVLIQDSPGGLTDSLRIALKKPLPEGPAPKKPPRTFQHSIEEVLAQNLQKNSSFLHVAKSSPERKSSPKKTLKRGDPKYMLNKLEMALKNNKLRSRKQQKVEVSTTSGEDSDDSLLFRSKSCRSLPKPPLKFQDSLQNSPNLISNGLSDSILGDLNCFNTFGCTNPAYERIREPNSSFFVSKAKDPIYAEPIQRRSGSSEESPRKINRNSLYYMSTDLIHEEIGQKAEDLNGGTRNSPLQDLDNKMEDPKGDVDSALLNRQLSAENSSISSNSFTSDLDSTPSPITDDPHVQIRYLIDNFETRRSKPQRTSNDSAQEDGGSCTSSRDSASRVEELKRSLKNTLDQSFNNDSSEHRESRDSDSETTTMGQVARMVARFRTFQKTAPKYQQPQINTETLFNCCLVIERVRDCAQIKFKFPSNVDVPRDIEHLCFPESPDSPPLEGSSAAQTYTLLMTSETGDRTYGYCRRVLPEGSAHCLPLAYCILSKYRAPRFYKKILLELESRHGMQDKFRDELISQFYYKKFPKPGESILINLTRIEGQRVRESSQSFGLEDSLDLTSYIQVNKAGEYGSLNPRKTAIFISDNDMGDSSLTPTYVAYEGHKTELVLTLHPDTRYEDADLKRLHKLPPDILLKIFSSLLLERKVILISSVISELSSCVDSLQSILYPFTWYHTFIPILPESLWDIVESPTPVVCGVLSEDAIEDKHIENGIVVNLDTKTVLFEEKDEMKILGSSMHKIWRQFITLANNAKSMEYVHSVYLADAYLSVFICCFKNYKQYVVNGKFLKDELVKNGKTKGIRRFLKMFTETCMFHAFMDAALNNPESLAAFDKKIELYGSDESRIILDKLLGWHR